MSPATSRLVIASLAIIGALWAVVASGTALALVVGLVLFCLGWVFGHRSSTPGQKNRTRASAYVALASGVGVGLYILAGALAEAFIPGAGRDVVGTAFLASVAGIFVGLRFEDQSRAPK